MTGGALTGTAVDRRSSLMTQTPAEFLARRRSHSPKTLHAPAPDREALCAIMSAALRVPDHGALEPWRLIVIGPETRAALADTVRAVARLRDMSAGDAEKAAFPYETSPLIVAVVECPVETAKFPAIEQTYSAGAACAALVNAALAAGWGAGWVTGWAAHDAEMMQGAIGLTPGERVVGMVHIGTASAAPPERPRPDIAAKVDWRA